MALQHLDPMFNPTQEKDLVRRLGEMIGYGNMIELAHQCWDELLERDYGIKNHSEDYKLTEAEIILERRAKQQDRSR